MNNTAADERKLETQVILAVVAMSVFMGAGMLLHEGGHWIAAKSFRWDAQFSYSMVRVRNEDLTTVQVCVFKSAGPFVDFVFATIGIVYLFRTRTAGQQRSGRPGFWIASALVLATLRWLKAPFQPTSDEASVSELLGLPWFVVPWILLVPTCLTLGYMIRLHSRERTLIPLVIGFVCGMVSFLLWYLVVGPQLLPKN